MTCVALQLFFVGVLWGSAAWCCIVWCCGMLWNALLSCSVCRSVDNWAYTYNVAAVRFIHLAVGTDPVTIKAVDSDLEWVEVIPPLWSVSQGCI